MKTIGIDLWDGQARAAPNVATMMRPAQRPHVLAVDARALFLTAYPKLVGVCRAVQEPGLAVIAVDERTGRPAGIVTLRARIGRPVAAVVGRHDRCDLYLAGHEELALRQLAVVMAPVASFTPGTSVAYRVMDLRTGGGMADESGRALRGLRAEGPSVLRCGGYLMYMLPLGDPTDWPERADDAWAMLPERVYFDELDHAAGGSVRDLRVQAGQVRQASQAPNLRATQSVVFRVQGPRDTGMALVGARGEDLAGQLEIIGTHRRVTLDVGQTALRDGILIGRYERCDGGAAIDDPSLSRVHALLVHADDRLLMVDTASFNGTRVSGGEPMRLVELDRDLELALGKGTRIRWRWTAG